MSSQKTNRPNRVYRLFQKLQERLGFLQQARVETPGLLDSITASTASDEPLWAELRRINLDLESEYLELKKQSAVDLMQDEGGCRLERIQDLEMQRLNLLTHLNGQNLPDYANSPLKIR